MGEPMEAAKHVRDLKGLTALRFLAAVWVFSFHVHIRWPLPGLGPLEGVVNQGALGVTLFFVLSGYILERTYAPSFKNPSRGELSLYAIKRFARIAPTYIVGMLLCLPWLFQTARVGAGGAGMEVAGAIGVTNLLGINAWFPSISMAWFGTGGWSISVELFFYAAFPLVAWGIARLGPTGVAVMLGVSILALCIPTLLLLSGQRFELAYAFPLSRFPEFATGMLAASFEQSGRLKQMRRWWAVTALAGLGYLVANGERWPEHVQHNPIVVPLIALVVVGVAQTERGLLHSRLLGVLGKASYAFYVVQMPLLFLLASIDKRSPLGEWLPSVVILGGAFVANTLLSLLLWRFVEEPFRKGIIEKFETWARIRPLPASS